VTLVPSAHFDGYEVDVCSDRSGYIQMVMKANCHSGQNKCVRICVDKLCVLLAFFFVVETP
jgi:hypothetical protein